MYLAGSASYFVQVSEGSSVSDILERAESVRAKFAHLREYRQELFARGYVISTQAVWAPDEWLSTTFEQFSVAHDPRLQRHTAARLLVLGLIFDVRDSSRPASACVALLSDELERSTHDFFEALSFMSGRYVIVLQTHEAVHLLTDATGMKPAFYGGGFVSSHVGLTAVQFGARVLPGAVSKFGFAGLSTSAEGVRLLTPNTWLNLHTMVPSRYWPMQPLPRRPIGACVDELSGWLRTSAEYLAHHHRPLLSVTAGIDSRLTLAAFRGLPFKSFTYQRADGLPANPHDVPLAETLRDRLKLDHLTLDGRTGTKLPELDKVFKQNLFKSHVGEISHLYYTTFRDGDYLHVRSNLGEVGRRFYGGERRGDPFETYQQVYALWPGSTGMSDSAGLAAFREFVELTGLLRAPISPYTLFYWEHRMGGWHSQVVAESDPAFDCVSIFNSRAILSSFLAVSDAEQESGELFRRLIERLWPELAEFPVNGKSFRSAGLKDFLKSKASAAARASSAATRTTPDTRRASGRNPSLRQKVSRRVRAIGRRVLRALKR